MAGLTPNERLSMLLSCYLDGELTPAELAEVVVALEHDLDAIAEFRSLRETRNALRTLPTPRMPMYLLPAGHLGAELSAYLDGELATGELPRINAHLDDCSECRGELADLDRSRTAVRSLPGLEPPDFLELARESKEARRKARWPGLAAAATGIAAVAIAFSVGIGIGGQDSVAVDVADLETRHGAVVSGSPSAGVRTAGP